jgi:hypothetical protein
MKTEREGGRSMGCFENFKGFIPRNTQFINLPRLVCYLVTL